MPSFETLPVEIRWQIYSYLLLGDDVVQLERNSRLLSLLPNFQTAIFRLNKRISAEALLYFHEQNAFVTVTLSYTDSPFGVVMHNPNPYIDGPDGDPRHFLEIQEFIPRFQCYCPINIVHNRPACSALFVGIDYQSLKDLHWGTYTCIVSARRFPLFVRLVNTYTRSVFSVCQIHVSSVAINSTSHYPDIGLHNRGSIIRGLQLLGPALMQDQDLSKPTIRFRSDEPIWGFEPAELASSATYVLHRSALADFFGLVRDVKALFEQDCFQQVVQICDAARNGVFTDYDCVKAMTTQEGCKHLQAMLDMRMMACLCFTRLGKRDEAFECAFTTQNYLHVKGQRIARMLDLSYGQIADRVANALTDYELLGTIEQVCSNYRKELRARDGQIEPGIFDEPRFTLQRLKELQMAFWPDVDAQYDWNSDEVSTGPIFVNAP